MGVVPRKPTGARCSEKVCRCLQSPLAGAHSYARKTGARPEGLLPGGHNTPGRENASTWRLPDGLGLHELDRVGQPHTGCGPGDEDGPLKSKYGRLSGFHDAPPATGSHNGDGLLQNLLPAHPQLPLCKSLRVGSHSSLEPGDGQYTSARSGGLFCRLHHV